MEKSGKALVSGDEILDYIPQRPPIVMVDAFYGLDEDSTFCCLGVADNTLFCVDGVLDECGLSNMWTVGSFPYRVFVSSRRKSGIGSVNGLEIHSLPRACEEMCSRITVLQEMMNITLIHASVAADGRPVCDCRMKIVLKDE